MTFRVAAWNAAWARGKTERGKAVRSILADGEYDVICLTESFEELLPAAGHTVTSNPDYGYPIKPGRRKVTLWSRSPWRETDNYGNSHLPTGRFVSGITRTPVGDVRVVGVCIPWKDAHVRTGQRNRQPWEDHLAFLRGLEIYLKTCADGLPTIVTGDFNQRIPRRGAPRHVAEQLLQALDGFQVATAGKVPPINRELIDHVAYDRRLTALGVQAWPRVRADGLSMSDHDGVSVELAMQDRGL